MDKEISIKQSNQLKAIAILMMVFLHLFNRGYEGLFEPVIFIGTRPLSFYISLFCDACVPIFAFVSGYGLYYKFQKDTINYAANNWNRIRKLYVNYWIILIVFVPILGTLLNKEGYPGSLLKFVLNFIALGDSYNAIWWFFLTYLLLVLTSKNIFGFVQSYSVVFLFLISSFFYVVSFYFRVYKSNLFDSEILNWLQGEICLYGTSFLPFIVGAIAMKYKWNTQWTILFHNIPYKKLVFFFVILGLIIVHGIIPNFIIAPFLAIPFIFIFTQIQLGSLLDKVLDFLAIHATNIWLIHAFFYMIYFPELIYKPQYVLLIFMFLLLLSVLSSIIINKIQVLLLKKIKL